MANSTKTCRVKTDLRNNSALQVYFKANVVLNRMMNNAYFPLPNLLIERVALCRDELGNILKLGTTKLHLHQRNQAQKKLADALTRLAGLVQCVSGGDAGIIVSTGFGIRKERSKVHLRPAPVIKRYMKMPQHGWVKLMWNADIFANLYFIYLSEVDNPEERKRIATSTKSSAIIKGLESGKKYILQVNAINSAGESGMSRTVLVYEVWL